MVRKLTESLEDYLEVIAELIAKNGHAHTKEIADILNVKMPSVTGALRQLEQMELIIYKTHHPVVLTTEGKKVADWVILRHNVLKLFFGDILNLSSNKASETACRIEHVVDQDTIDRIVLFSDSIQYRTDAKKLQTFLSEAIANIESSDYSKRRILTSLNCDRKFRLEAFGRNIVNPERMGLTIGAEYTLQHISLDKTQYQIEADGKNFTIATDDAENLWVTALIE